MPQNITDLLKPMVLEDDELLFSITTPSYFVVRGPFFSVCLEDASQTPVVDYFLSPGQVLAA